MGIGMMYVQIELCMGLEILFAVAFCLAVVHGWLWSMQQRQRAVEAAYEQIRNEVRRERTRVNRY